MVTVLALFFLAAIAPCFSDEIDQCIMGRPCTLAALACPNAVNAFSCTCVCSCGSGFQFDGRTCVDVNECAALVSPCGPGVMCRNTEGSYNCSLPLGSVCPLGFLFNQGACMTIDENSTTSKAVGGSCPAGFRFNQEFCEQSSSKVTVAKPVCPIGLKVISGACGEIISTLTVHP